MLVANFKYGMWLNLFPSFMFSPSSHSATTSLLIILQATRSFSARAVLTTTSNMKSCQAFKDLGFVNVTYLNFL